MNLEAPLEFIGRQADNEAVRTLLRTVAGQERVQIKRGETDCYVENKRLGICLLFESEQYIHTRYHKELPSDAPLLVAIFVYGENHDEYSRFEGQLFGGVSLTDDRETILRKLGPSTNHNKEWNAESWSFDSGLRLFIDYEPGETGVLVAQFGFDIESVM